MSLAGVPSLISDTAASGTAHVSTVLDTDGYGEYDQFGGVATFDWYAPNTVGIGSSYWARMDLNSGTGPTSGPSLSTWHSLSSFLNWEWSRATVGITAANVTLRIASDAAGSTVVATATYDIEAERT